MLKTKKKNSSSRWPCENAIRRWHTDDRQGLSSMFWLATGNGQSKVLPKALMTVWAWVGARPARSSGPANALWDTSSHAAAGYRSRSTDKEADCSWLLLTESCTRPGRGKH